MRILVLGGSGMLGHKVFGVASRRHEAHVSFRADQRRWLAHPAFTGIAGNRAHFAVDAQQFETVLRALDVAKPDVVVNCVGLVKQRKVESRPSAAIHVNSLFPHQLAEACVARDVRVIHFSTDCVFSGTRGRYAESDAPDPVDLYGRTKALGEVDSPRCLTLRTSIIGWELGHRTGLLEWFRSQRGEAISGYRRAIFSGLSTRLLADLVLNIIETRGEMSGIYHVSSAPISKYELLLSLRERLGWRDLRIVPDETFHCDRSLDCSRFETETAWRSPDWPTMIDGLISELPIYEEWERASAT